MVTQSERINRLDKDILLIKKDIEVIKNNHLKHIESDVSMIKKVMWSVGFLVFSNLLAIIMTQIK
jgi:predicted neutral ceramidase superfamily lipid hydrolase